MWYLPKIRRYEDTGGLKEPFLGKDTKIPAKIRRYGGLKDPLLETGEDTSEDTKRYGEDTEWLMFVW